MQQAAEGCICTISWFGAKKFHGLSNMTMLKPLTGIAIPVDKFNSCMRCALIILNENNHKYLILKKVAILPGCFLFSSGYSGSIIWFYAVVLASGLMEKPLVLILSIYLSITFYKLSCFLTAKKCSVRN